MPGRGVLTPLGFDVMLTELVVEGLGVIERTELVLSGGCSALTGETGAGKTLVVAALGLLVGGKADRSLVRSGTPEARVEGRFCVRRDREVVRMLEENGAAHFDGEDGDLDLVLSRTVSADGRGRVRINGRMAAAGTLAELAPHLVEIAGQHEHVRIGSTTMQRRLLDNYAGGSCEALAAEVAREVKATAHADAMLERLSAAERARETELDALRADIGEIESAAIGSGETERLKAEAMRLEHAESIASATTKTMEWLRGDGGVEELLARSARTLDAVKELDPELAPLGGRLDGALYEVADVAADVAARSAAPDPDGLELVRERLALLARLHRRYGGSDAAVLDHLRAARARVEQLEGAGDVVERWVRERDDRARAALESATRLSAARADAAARLSDDIHALLGELALPDARLEVRLEPRPLHEGGLEAVGFFVAVNPGEEAKPLGKVASGGELARIALALHLVTAGAGTSTMVFDEVDAGVGGRAAQAVGRCLSELAKRSGAQVIVVTHLPQVTAFADTHLKVTKTRSRGRTTAVVERVDGEARVAELSRMLAGLPDSASARGHAQELLELAGTR